MMTRRAMACVAAFAAAISVGALGYAVLWAFDFSELRPLVQPPPREAKQETKRPAPRRRPLVVVAPRVPGEDAREVAARTLHAAPPGDMLALVPMAPPDERSALVAVAPPPTPPTPGEDVREVAARAPRAMPFGETVAIAPMRAPDERSALVAILPPPTPPTPGEDAPAIAASARGAAASTAADRPRPDGAQARSDLTPQEEAAIPPIEVLPDPEPTGTVQPGPLILHVPEPAER